MGYDNTVHLVSINKFPNEKVHYAELLITVELRGMSYDFPKLFDKTVEDFHFFSVGNGEHGTCYGYDEFRDKHYKDPYGERMTYTDDIKKVIKWLEEDMEKSKRDYNGNPYRRDTMLYNVLNSFKMYDWRGTDIVLVHEGH